MGALRKRWFFAAIMAASVLPGATHATPADSSSYPIGAGDVLEISIYAGGEMPESLTAEVSSSGTITTPLLGELSVAGLTSTELSQRLTELLSQGYYISPRVIVSVKEYGGKVYIIGEVRRPGAYSLGEGLTVLNACILAGGFSEYAAPNRVKVTRLSKGRTQVLKIDLRKVQKGEKPDLVLQPGDRIDVPTRKF